MGRKLSSAQILKAAVKLPLKEREALSRESLTREGLDEKIRRAKFAMRRDLFFGMPWFLVYCVFLWRFGLEWQTATVLVVGIFYFAISIMIGGTYGLNRKRVKVYEELLRQLED